MRPRRGRPPGRSSGSAVALSVVSGAATAGVAGAYVGSAWNGYAHCHGSPGGAGCAPHPFWGFSPELYLVACLTGIVAGALLAVLGVLASRGVLRARPTGYALLVLSGAGVLAYGGFGVGAALGVAAGAVLIASRASPTSAPSEWSGSLPVGVPPAPRGARRTMPGRPPVTEWDGIVAAAPFGPPGASRGRVALPQADRLAAALAKSRIAVAGKGAGTGSPPPVIVLPPPPLGLRSSFRPPSSAVIVPPPEPTPPPPSETPVPRPIPAPVFGVPPVERPSSDRRWRPETSDLTPWTALESEMGSARRGGAGPPPPEAPPAPRTSRPSQPAASAPAAPAARAPKPAGTSPRPTPRPMKEFTVPSTVAGSTTPARPSAPAAVPTPPPRAASSVAAPAPLPSPPSAPPPAPPSPSPQPREELPQVAAPSPPMPPTFGPPPSAVPIVPPPDGVYRPSPPAAPPAQPRTKAWKCPNCRTINAPWSPRCTNCKLEPGAS